LSAAKIKTSEIAKISEVVQRYLSLRQQIFEFQGVHGKRGSRLVYRQGDDEYTFNHFSLEVKNFLHSHFHSLSREADNLRKEIEDAGFECDI